MLKFLANNIEQMDLALEHLLKGDANNARFGLMLVDNVLEITLHQIAKDSQREAESWMYRDNPYKHADGLRDALGQHFESKVKFAQKIGLLSDDVSETIIIFHSFRNEVYHVGVQHEAILSTISRFHFKIACDFLGSYSPSSISYSHGMALPERARKYFKEPTFRMNVVEEYQAACTSLQGAVSFNAAELAKALADHLEKVIKEQDTAIHMIATEGPRKNSRDGAVAETMAWKVAFTDKGRAFARDNGWLGGSILSLVKWLEANYPLPIWKDPIAAWQKRAHAVRHEKNPHKVLKKYRDFMMQTAETRVILDEAHAGVDQYIEEQIERMRGN
jgi:hypothetical protein